MRNVLETGTARPRQAHRLRLRQHGATPPPTIPEGSSYTSIASMAGALALGGLLHAVPVQAIEFGSGAFQGSLDTTISHGVAYRVQRRDAELVDDVNSNDGNLNYDRGLISNTSKFTTDLDIGTGDFGMFVRATGFVDFENEHGTRERTPLSDEAKHQVGRDLEVLDAYILGAFDIGDAAVDLRAGKHVLNWGESTFIPNGINAINPFDVSKLRQPGSELREALLPVGLVSMAVAPTDTLSVEGFYQLDWEETMIDPVGSYFSSTDYVGPGAREAVISDIPGNDDGGFAPLKTPLIGVINSDLTSGLRQEDDPDFASALRGPDRTPSDSGQWGLALRYLAEEMNDTEFGFYFINHHSRLPTVGAQTGSRLGVETGLAADRAVGGRLAADGAVGGQNSATIAGVTAMVTEEVRRAVQPGSIDPDAEEALIQQRVEGTVDGIGAALALDRYVKTGSYFIEYPEDIQLFGLSFNTLLGASGWALQGEYSFRHDAPLQRAERKVIEDGLKPIIDALGLDRCASNPAREACPKAPGGAPLPPGFFEQRLQALLAGQTPRKVQGYIERNVSQIQATATKVFGPAMGADGVVFVAEAALMHVHDMPDRATMPLESPAGGVLETGDADADATSWGYRVAARLDYNNAIGPVNLYPYTQFLHDVSGNSPAPSGPFVDGRTAVTIGMKADYLSRWQADIGYTRYAGDGNELSDRDFISASIKYSF